MRRMHPHYSREKQGFRDKVFLRSHLGYGFGDFLNNTLFPGRNGNGLPFGSVVSTASAASGCACSA